MSYYECDDGQHRASLPNLVNKFNDSSDSDDSDVEVTSLFDPAEHELIELSNYLRVHSDDDDEDEREDDNENNQVPHSLVSYSDSNDSADDLDQIQTRLPSPRSVAASARQSNRDASSAKLKRRQWSVHEKLQAQATFEMNDNKYKTCQIHGCSPSQLRKWLVVKDDLQAVAKQKKGVKRKRVNGAGKKLKYVDLDFRLLAWFRECRSVPTSGTVPTATAAADIRREKVTFRRLQRQGDRIADELRHSHPSIKWYRRFLVRHRLSLQRPKRQQKIPIDEAHRLAHSFYNFLRRSSTWAPKRSSMGCFTPKDVFNMDESPLSLFGDQTKLSVNDVNTPNEISGCLSNKRFASVILTVSAEESHCVDPVLLFKGKGRVLQAEREQYAKGIKVIFTPKAVINKPSMDEYIDFWHGKVKDDLPKLFITDSAGSHLNADTVRRLRKRSVVVVVIPKGTNMYFQVLDVNVFSVFKQHYYDAAEEWLEENGPRSKVKLSASQSRILCTRLTRSAWLRTLKSVDFKAAFHDIGYTWRDNSPIHLRTLAGFCFDSSNLDSSLVSLSEDDDEEKIEREAREANRERDASMNTKDRVKQSTLLKFWKQ